MRSLEPVSMMNPPRARGTTPAQAQQRLLRTALPCPEHPARTPLPLLPAQRAQLLQRLVVQRLLAQCGQAAQWGQWALRAPLDPRGAAEVLSLAGAFWQQWFNLQTQWVDGLASWAEESGELHQANTVAKYVDQEVNLQQQLTALMTAQGTATLLLLENTQNNVGWWLAQRAEANP